MHGVFTHDSIYSSADLSVLMSWLTVHFFISVRFNAGYFVKFIH